MSSSSSSATAETFAPAHYRAQLETLVSLLQVANAVPDMANPTLLWQMIDMLQGHATAGSLPGVADLLRCWKAALNDFGRRGEPFTQDDLTRMSLWFHGLEEHHAGRLDREGRHMLARLPEDISWLPRLSPSFVHVIARRLDMAAAMPPMPDLEYTSTVAPTVSGANAAPDAFSIEADTAILFATLAAMPDATGANPIEADAAISTTPDDARAFAVDADAFATAFDSDVSAVSQEEPPVCMADISEGTIWIGQEELDRTRQAIVDQLLPLAQAWSDAPDADTRAAVLEELCYQCQLIVNVMELIGTPALAHGMAIVLHGIEQGTDEIPPGIFATWCSALLATIDLISVEPQSKVA